jgi:predicted DNA-binding transcriptional regulator AlpA
MVDTIGAAAYTGLAPQTLEILRLKGNGPVYAKLGRSVRYSISDLDAWIDAAKRRSTSQNVG